MSPRPRSTPHIYIECDLPEGVTIAEYRRRRRPARPGRSGLVRLLSGVRPHGPHSDSWSSPQRS